MLVAIVDCGSPSASLMALTFIGPWMFSSFRTRSRIGEARPRTTSMLCSGSTARKCRVAPFALSMPLASVPAP